MWIQKLLSHFEDKDWYRKVWLYFKWKCTILSIHRLISYAFIPNSENKPQINHINWIKTDNRVENLEWATASENWVHAYKLWLSKITDNHHFKKNHPHKWKFWVDNHCSKKVYQYTLDWKFIREWWSTMDIQRELWINNSSIWSCCNWNLKTAGGFIWRYYLL